MARYLVLSFSHSGNNRYLAHRIGRSLPGETREIRPFTSNIGLLFLLSLAGIGVGTGIDDAELDAADEVVVCGPIWGGLLIAPVRGAIGQAAGRRKPVHFATCCGSSDDDKDGRWGYAQVLRAAAQAGGEWLRTAEAFPAGLAEPARPATEAGEIRLADDNFHGAIAERRDRFVERVRAASHSRGSA